LASAVTAVAAPVAVVMSDALMARVLVSAAVMLPVIAPSVPA